MLGTQFSIVGGACWDQRLSHYLPAVQEREKLSHKEVSLWGPYGGGRDAGPLSLRSQGREWVLGAGEGGIQLAPLRFQSVPKSVEEEAPARA
jgi:hypothetical protein